MPSLSLQLLQEAEQDQGGTLPCSAHLRTPVLEPLFRFRSTYACAGG